MHEINYRCNEELEVSLPKGSDGMRKGKVVKVIGIILFGFFLFVIIGSVYEGATGLDMRTGEKKTSSSLTSSSSSNNVYDIYDRKTSECNRYGSPGNFPSMENQFAWNDCMNSANSWLNNNLP